MIHPALALLLLPGCSPGGGPVEVRPPPEPVTLPAGGGLRYTLSFPDAQAHLVDVVLEAPLGEEPVELMMATWTPGSYLVRDYARQVEGLRVDPPATLAKTAKNRWTVQPHGAEALRLRYRVYGRELSVRSNFIDRDLGILNGAATFLVPVDQMDQPAEIALELPPTWPQVATALDPVPDAPHTYRARDYDELVDHPFLAGDLAIYPFEVQGVPHQLVNWGEQGLWDGERAAKDVETIVRAQVDFWGVIPYDRYLFLHAIAESGGGLEHERSTLVLSSRWTTRDEERYRRWLGLISHEFFHTWNVKRLRPVELGPFDYEHEVLTENLWIAEGFTSYYDDLLLVRAGLLTEDQWIGRMRDNIQRLQTTPGRLVHPLSETSRDAWIKYYRSDENSVNTTISYYTKGAVVAFLLDAKIRKASGGRRSLDTVMRTAWDRYSGERGYTSEEFRAVASEVARLDLGPWFARAVDSTEELDYDEALAYFGLRFAPEEGAPEEGASEEQAPEGEEAADEGAAPDEEDRPGWIGLRLGHGNRVREVLRDTPAWKAGFNVDDEVLAVDGIRLPDGGWSDRMARYSPGETVEVLISRRGALRSLETTLEAEPDPGYYLEIDPEANPLDTEHRKRLLGLDE